MCSVPDIDIPIISDVIDIIEDVFEGIQIL